jgi:ribosomal protein L11 methyltransferase
VVQQGHFRDDTTARRAARALRARGFATVVRPDGAWYGDAWRAATRPLVIGERIQVCFPWSDVDPAEAPLLVEIDPGASFGAGRHPSTRLLLTELACRLGGGESVLDVGCGSGVLAVAAARLGAARVVALDVDRRAVAATRANAARNGVGAIVAASTTPASRLSGTFDAIVANIGAGALVTLAPALRSRLSERGWLGLSGLSPAQISVVAAAYTPARVISTPTDGDWAAAVLLLQRGVERLD